MCASIEKYALINIHVLFVMHDLQCTTYSCAAVVVTSAMQDRCGKCTGKAVQSTEYVAANLLLQGNGLGQGPVQGLMPGQGQVHLALSIGEQCSSQAAHRLACQE